MSYVQFFQLQDGIITLKKTTVLNCVSLCNLGFQLDSNLSQTELTTALLYQTQHYNGHTIEIVDYWTMEDVLQKLNQQDEMDIKLSPVGRILHNCLTANKTYINIELNLLQNGPIKQLTQLLYPFCLFNNNNNMSEMPLKPNSSLGLLNGCTKNIKDTYLRIPKDQALFIHRTRQLKRTITNVFLVIAPYRESTIDPLNKSVEKLSLHEQTITSIPIPIPVDNDDVDNEKYTYHQSYSASFVFTDENATSAWVLQNAITRCIYYTPAFSLTHKSYREIAIIKLGHIPANTPPPRVIHHITTNSHYFLFDNFIFKPQNWNYQTFSYDNQ